MAWRWLIIFPLNFVAFLLLYSYPEGITETEEPWRRQERAGGGEVNEGRGQRQMMLINIQKGYSGSLLWGELH
jgi:hypothetical protein